MLIVEGTDLVGKTTLCQKLVKRLNTQIGGYQYQHFTRLPEGWDYYWSYVNRMSRRIVQDRFHDSEPAYCYGRGEPCVFDGLAGACQYVLVEAKLALLGAVKVVVTCDDNELARRFEKKGDDMYGLNVIVGANHWFEQNLDRFHHHFHCDGPESYPDDLFIDEVVKHYMIRQNALDRILRSFPRHGL